MTKTLRKGSKVEWASQSSGFNKVKSGKIVAVVPAGKKPEDYLPNGTVPKSSCGFGSPRNHKSYLVQVGKSYRIYWPLVSHLNKPITVKDRIKTRKIKRFAWSHGEGLTPCGFGGLVHYDDHRAVVKELIQEIERLSK